MLHHSKNKENVIEKVKYRYLSVIKLLIIWSTDVTSEAFIAQFNFLECFVKQKLV